MMTTAQYIEIVNNRYKLGNATESTFRGDLTQLIESMVPEIANRLGLVFVPEKTAPLNLPKVETSAPPLEGLDSETLSSPPLEGLGVAKTPGYQTANSKTYRFVKEFKDDLKKNPTQAEQVMWEQLRNKKTGHKIRRQHIIDDFIADFVCLRKKLVVEIDGEIHLKQKEYDDYRTARLGELGYEVIRFTNQEVFENAELVTSKIKEKLDEKLDFQLGDAAPLNLPKGETLNTPYLEMLESDKLSSPNLYGLGSETLSSPDLDGLGSETLSSPPLEGLGEAFAPIDILDYIYAVLHSPTYREKYKEFLKIDFPRVPYPKDVDTFWQLVALGCQIRQIHLLESPVVESFITKYPVGGTNIVDKPIYKDGHVYINDAQYFAHVPEVAWTFYIGGYQPAQKWLKDRKGRTLSMDDIFHYQKIIVALSETDRLMKAIDQIEIE
jgi:very-short-patch-repair endonuclease